MSRQHVPSLSLVKLPCATDLDPLQASYLLLAATQKLYQQTPMNRWSSFEKAYGTLMEATLLQGGSEKKSMGHWPLRNGLTPEAMAALQAGSQEKLWSDWGLRV